MGFRLYASNRTEHLATALGQVMARPCGSLLAPETIVVQGRGMATWLAQALAQVHGVFAHADFVYPGHFVRRCLDAALGPCAVYDEAAVLWHVMAMLEELETDTPTELEPLAAYVRAREGRLARYELASRLSVQFDRYWVYRPDWLSAFVNNGEVTDGAFASMAWQPAFYRRLVSRLDVVPLDAQCDAFEQSIARLHARPEGVPERISLFGLSSLPPVYIRVFAALCRVTEIHAFSFSPSPFDWWNVTGRATQNRARRAGKDLGALHMGNEHRFLTSFAALGAEHRLAWEDALTPHSGLVEVDVEDRHEAVAATKTALDRLQNGIFELVAERPAAHPNKRGISPNQLGLFDDMPMHTRPQLAAEDRSVLVHACHGPMRELEVLHDELIGILTSTKNDIDARDIVVLMPDVEGYAPFVRAVFDRDGDDPLAIPYRLYDRAFRSESAVWDAMLRCFEFSRGRAEASQLIDLLGLELFRTRYELAPADVDRIAGWVADSGARWGLDARDRTPFGLQASSSHTWKAGLDRLFLGLAMLPLDSELYEGVLAFEDVEGADARILGQLARIVEHLTYVRTRAQAGCTVGDLASLCDFMLTQMVSGDAAHAPEVARVRAAVAQVVSSASSAGYEGATPWEGFCERVEAHLAESQQAFLSEGVTFCAMVPMRSIPFRVVCLVGMSDGAFPRRESHQEFDLTETTPRRGDKNRRKEDLFLFLETILAARERLIITYSGRSIHDNRERPPSVVVDELLAVLCNDWDPPGARDGGSLAEPERLAAVRAHFVVGHALHRFSPRYFDGVDPRLRSFDTASLTAARGLVNRSHEPPRFWGHAEHAAADPFEHLAAASPDKSPVDLLELTRFFSDPWEYWIRKQFRASLRTYAQEIPDREPNQLDGLDRYQIGQRMLELILVGRQAQDILEILRAEGRLPWGNLAEGVFSATYGEVVALCEAIPSALRGAPRTISTVALPLSRPLWGSVGGLVGQTMIRVRYVREHPKHLVASWIEFLALCAAAERGGHRADAGGITAPPSACLGLRHEKGGRPVTMEWTPPTDVDAASLLERFIEVFSWAQVVPLPFSPQTCWDAAHRKDVAKAFEAERQRSSAMRRLLDDDGTLFGGLPTCDGARSLTFEVITDALFRPLAEQCDRARSKKTSSSSSSSTRTDSSNRSGKRQTSKGRGKGAARDT